MTIRTPNNSYYVSGASGGQNHTLPFGADRFEDDDLFVYVWNAGTETWDKKTVTTHYTVSSTQVSFTSSHIPSTRVIVLRKTDVDEDHPKSDFVAGASIKAQDLDNNQIQALRGIKELRDQKLSAVPSIAEDGTPSNPKMYVNLDMNGYKVINQPAGYITSTDILDGTIVTADLANSSVTANKLASDSVTTAKIAADAVNGTKIADNSINSEHYVDGSIDTAHIADAQVTSAKLADNIISNAKMMNNSVNTAEIVNSAVTADKIPDGTILTAKLADSIISNAKMMNNSVDTAEIINNAVTTAKIADSAITNAKLADAELVELATMGGNTASALADLTQAEVQILDGATVTTAELNTLDGVTATATEINQLDGNTLKTSSTDFTSSIQFPSAAQIDARITARIDPLGGFEAIADEDSFPATAPPVGTVISIANANSLAVNSSGVGAGTRAGGSDAVVINGFPSGFNSTSLDDGIGLLVIATSTAHTYDFHRVVAKNEDVRQLSSDINDFKARYRIGSSNPTTDNDAGDLFFNTGTSKMLVRNAGNSAWQEVQAVGDFFINTISSSSGTGGGSATFNGSAYRFTLSNAPITAQQLLVSINGVVQKPNSGTSQPSEGFVLNGADIIFSAAPASGAAGFFITIGSSVGIGTPSDNTVSTAKLVNSAVTSAKIADGTIVNADVNASAAIAGTKISPDFGSQNVITTGNIEVGTVIDLNANGSITTTREIKVEGDLTPTGLSSRINNFGSLLIGTTSNSVLDAKASIESGNGDIRTLGKIGIGTLSPAYQLDVQGSGNSRIRVKNTSVSGEAQFHHDGNGDLFIKNSVSGRNLSFVNNGSERLRIDSSGRVAIGTTTVADTATALVIKNSASGNEHTLLDIVCDTNETARVRFSEDGSNFPGEIKYDTLNHFLSFNANSSERMRIDSSGKVGIGTTSPAQKLHVSGKIQFGENSTYYGLIEHDEGITGANIYTSQDSGGHIFKEQSTERMRIDNSGRLLAGLTSSSKNARIVAEGNSDNAASSAEVYLQRGTATPPDGADLASIHFADNTGTTGAVIRGRREGGTWSGSSKPSSLLFSTCADGGTALATRMMISNDGRVATHMSSTSGLVLGTAGNGTNYTIIKGKSSSTGINTGNDVFYVYGNGNVQNSNNSYGQISDQKLKENIVDANSQWDNIKDVRVRNFNFIEGQTHTQIGVVAQELETVSPGLIDEAPDRDEDGNDLGTVTKSVKYSVLYMKAVKALQEAMERIETLETQNASLEARLTILEGAS